KSAMTQTVVAERLLPVAPREAPPEDAAGVEYLFEPNRGALLERLVPEYVHHSIPPAPSESHASGPRAPPTPLGPAPHKAQERQGDDRYANAPVQQGPPSGDHQGADGDHRRQRGAQGVERIAPAARGSGFRYHRFGTTFGVARRESAPTGTHAAADQPPTS